MRITFIPMYLSVTLKVPYKCAEQDAIVLVTFVLWKAREPDIIHKVTQKVLDHFNDIFERKNIHFHF